MEKNRISTSKMISDNKNHRVILSLKFERLNLFFLHPIESDSELLALLLLKINVNLLVCLEVFLVSSSGHRDT